MLHINSKIHPNTKSTPFALMFGRNPYFKAGLDNSVEELTKEESETRVTHFWNTFRREVVPHIMSIKKDAFQKTKYRKKLSTYKVGDIVMWAIPELDDKSVPRFEGPFEVTGVLPHNKYKVKGKHYSFEAPANFLKKVELREGEELF